MMNQDWVNVPETLSLLRQLKNEAGIGRSEGIGAVG